MKYLVTIFLLIAAANLQAETRYVSDELRVPLRSSPCSRCAIIHQGIKSGAALEVLSESDDGWTQVKTRSGLEGWLPSQYLLKQQIAKFRIASIEKSMTGLRQENRKLSETLRQLQGSNNQYETEMRTLSEQNSSIDKELRRIKQVSANALNLEKQNKELLKRNGILQSEIDVLTAANERLESKDSQTWFLYGAISVVLGALLSIILPMLKRRKRFSEWA